MISNKLNTPIKVKAILSALAFALLLPVCAFADIKGPQSFNLQVSSAVTPDPAFPTLGQKEFDDPQMPGDYMVATFTMTPSTSTGWTSYFNFRQIDTTDTNPVSTNSYHYALMLTPTNVGMISIVNGVSTPIKGTTAPYSISPTKPAHFQLIENGTNYTLTDLNTGSQLFSITDSTITYGYKYELVTVGSLCTWTNFKVQANNTKFGPLQSNVLMVQDVDEVNINSTVNMTNRLGFDQSNCQISLNLQTMVAAPDTNTQIASITARQCGSTGDGQDYQLFFYSDHCLLMKSVNNVETVLGKSAPGSISFVPGSGTFIKIIWQLQGSTLTVINGSNNQTLISCTDTTYPQGFQFGLYTMPGFDTCWMPVRVSPLP